MGSGSNQLAVALRSGSDTLTQVSLDQVRYFVAVAEEENVGRAAKRLRIAQPPLSRQIRALESELGTPLFARTRLGMRLLPQGVVFLQHARNILGAVDAAVASVASVAQAFDAPVPAYPATNPGHRRM
jgi:DNA-binding transcriptional LysR family regulator